MKILIVEDNAADRKILRYTLERYDCVVIEAKDGIEGLEMAKIHKPDLIISDALMPRMDGFQLLRIVKTDEGLKHIPFIFYSAVYTGYREAELAISIGADAFIIKPKEPGELWDELKDILEKCKIKVRPSALTAELIKEDEEYLRKYSNVVAAKLEEKIAELSRTVEELKRREEELLSLNQSLIEAELKFQSLAQMSSDAIILANNSGTIASWNAGAENIFGYSKEEAVGKSLTMLMPERYREAHRKGIETVRSTGNSKYLGRIMEYHGLRKNGEEFPIELSVTIWPTKKEIFFMGILRDITERKRIMDKLAKSENELKMIIDTEPDCIKLLSPDCKVLEINPAGLAMFEADSPGQIVGKSVLPALASEYRRPYQKLAGRVLKGSVETLEFELVGLKGARRWLEIHAAPFKDADGKITALLGITRDITARKKVENELRERIEELEKFYEMAVGREMKMKELKEEIEKLNLELSKHSKGQSG